MKKIIDGRIWRIEGGDLEWWRNGGMEEWSDRMNETLSGGEHQISNIKHLTSNIGHLIYQKNQMSDVRCLI